jgi:hypothetical protein
MADVTAGFFEGLAARGHEPLLHSVTGTVRFDLAGRDGVEHWHVRVTRGEVAVSHRRSTAACVVSADRRLFERMVTGEVNALAAALRGDMVIEGQPALALAFQRLFPGPPSSAERRSAEHARRGR